MRPVIEGQAAAPLQASVKAGPSLVVCPATVLRQWQREFGPACGHISVDAVFPLPFARVCVRGAWEWLMPHPITLRSGHGHMCTYMATCAHTWPRVALHGYM